MFDFSCNVQIIMIQTKLVPIWYKICQKNTKLKLRDVSDIWWSHSTKLSSPFRGEFNMLETLRLRWHAIEPTGKVRNAVKNLVLASALWWSLSQCQSLESICFVQKSNSFSIASQVELTQCCTQNSNSHTKWDLISEVPHLI